MLTWLRQLVLPSATPRRIARVRAKYDAAQTTHENRRHWANADLLSANAANSAEVRRVLRSRARYEVANNSYAKGIVQTLAHYVVGTGPRLQMLTDDPEANRLIEKEFSLWAQIDILKSAQRLTSRQITNSKSVRTLTQFSIMSLKPSRPSAVRPDFPRSANSCTMSTPFSRAH